MEIRSDRTHRFDRSTGEVWEAICRTDSFSDWWPWLRRFEAEGLVEGDEWHCIVQPPLPYRLRFDIVIGSVIEAERVSAVVRGDIRGTAEMTLSDRGPGDGAGCALRLTSALRPANRALQVASTFAPWMARQGHDWVIRTGLDQFRRRAW